MLFRLTVCTPGNAYDTTPAAHARRMLEAWTAVPPGDPERMVAAMIASIDEPVAPRRPALGSDAYSAMHRQLTERLAALGAQRELALSTDAATMS